MTAWRSAGDCLSSGSFSSRGNRPKARLPPTAPRRRPGAAPARGRPPAPRAPGTWHPGAAGQRLVSRRPRRSARSGREAWGFFLPFSLLLISFPRCFHAVGLCHLAQRPGVPGTVGAEGPPPRRLPPQAPAGAQKGLPRPLRRSAPAQRLPPRKVGARLTWGVPARRAADEEPGEAAGGQAKPRRPPHPPAARRLRGAGALLGSLCRSVAPAAGWPGRRPAGGIGPPRGASLVARRRAAPGLRRGVGRGRAWAAAGCEGSRRRGRAGPGCPGGSEVTTEGSETRERGIASEKVRVKMRKTWGKWREKEGREKKKRKSEGKKGRGEKWGKPEEKWKKNQKSRPNYHMVIKVKTKKKMF